MTITLGTKKRGPGRPADEAHRARRRFEILEAATEVFAHTGFAEADVQLVADRLRIGKGTVYRYFPSKEALFLAAVDHGMRRLKEVVNTAAERTREPLERIANAVRAYLEFFDANPQVVELLIQERAQYRDRKQPTYFVHREANLGKWKALYEGLIQDGVVRDIAVERITDVISHLLYGTMFTNYFAGRTKSLASQCEDILDVLFQGILVKPKVEHNGTKRTVRKKRAV